MNELIRNSKSNSEAELKNLSNLLESIRQKMVELDDDHRYNQGPTDYRSRREHLFAEYDAVRVSITYKVFIGQLIWLVLTLLI